MANELARKVLLKVLEEVNSNKTAFSAPDKSYTKALEEIGLIEDGWDTTLTTFGRDMLNLLRP